MEKLDPQSGFDQRRHYVAEGVLPFIRGALDRLRSCVACSCPGIRYCERWGQQKGLWGTYSVGDGQESVGNSLEMTGLSTLLVAHATRYVDSCRR